MIRFIFLFLLCILPVVSSGGTMHIIVTGDIHGKMEDFSSLAAELKKYPDAVKIDLGDLFHGEPACDIKNGLPMIKMLNTLKYDLLVPGNHEFELSPAELDQLYRHFSGTVLGQWQIAGKKPPLQWKIIERNGIRCAFIGMTDNRLYQERFFYSGYRFKPELAALDAALAEIRKHPVDAVVLARHGGNYFSGTSAGKILFDRPEIDIMLCAHTHKEIPGSRSGRCFVVQPGAFAASAVLVTIGRQIKNSLHITGSLLRGTSASVDRECMKITGETRISLRNRLQKIRFSFTSFDDFARKLLKKFCQAAGSDAAVVDLPEMKPGNYSLHAALQLFPYRNQLLLITVTRAEYAALKKERPPRNRKRFFSPPPEGKNKFILAIDSFQLARSRSLKNKRFIFSGIIARNIITGDF